MGDWLELITLLHGPQPDRFLHDNHTSAESSNLPDPNQRDHWMFGAGRRICPGMWVAEREIWLAVSRVIWAFRLEAVPEHPIISGNRRLVW